MTIQTDRADAPDPQRIHIERMLARYPDLSETELTQVLAWFRKEASALDTALLASDEAIADSYRRFRNDHLDKLGMKERAAVWIVAVLLLAGIVAYALTT